MSNSPKRQAKRRAAKWNREHSRVIEVHTRNGDEVTVTTHVPGLLSDFDNEISRWKYKVGEGPPEGFGQNGLPFKPCVLPPFGHGDGITEGILR